MKIGYRTIKTAIGTGISIAIAEYLGLQFYTSAGIITILCIKSTRKRTFRSAWDRFLACIIGLFLAGIIFESLGYHPWVMAVLLLLLIPLNVLFESTEGIVTSTVIVLHIYSLKIMTTAIFLNELALITIGIGLALVVNLYMPNVEKKLQEYQKQVEFNFKRILEEFSVYLRFGDSSWDGKEITDTAKLLEEAKELAIRNFENSLYSGDKNYYQYFEMRERQFEILERLMLSISSIQGQCDQGAVVADFIDRVAAAVHPGNTAVQYLDELEKMREQFKDTDLPQDRDEFETRAALLHFVGEMKRYLLIKRDLNRNSLRVGKNSEGNTDRG